MRYCKRHRIETNSVCLRCIEEQDARRTRRVLRSRYVAHHPYVGTPTVSTPPHDGSMWAIKAPTTKGGA